MKKSKSTAYMHYLLLFLVFGMCVAILPGSFIGTFEYPKFLFLVLCTALIVSVHALMGEGHQKKIPYRFLIPIVLFTVGHVLAFLFSVDRSVSIVGSPFRYAGIVTYLALVSVWYVSTQYFARATDGKVVLFWKWVVASTVVVSIFAMVSPYISTELFVQTTLLQGRIFGTFGNPNYLAGVLLLVFPCAFLVPFVRIGARVASVTVLSVALFMTGSRTALAVFLLSLVWLCVVRYGQRYTKRTFFLLSGVVMLLFVSGASIFFYTHPELAQRLSLTQSAMNSFDTRMLFWSGAVPMVRDMPWTGYGHDTLGAVAGQYMPVTIQENSLSYVDRMHSEPLDILLMYGPMTLMGFLLFFGVCLYTTFRAYRRRVDAHAEAAVCIGMSSLFLFLLINFSSLSILTILFLMSGYVTGSYMKHTAPKGLGTSI